MLLLSPSLATGEPARVRRRWPGNVLVALDGSYFGESVLPHARALASAFGRPLHLVTVLDPALTGGTVTDSAECRLQLIETERYLAGLAKELVADGFEARYEAREGDPAHEVVAAIREREAGLVVIASRPRLGGEGIVSRGVAQGVISSSDASLLVARGDRMRPSGPRSEPTYRRIAVGVDGSSVSHRALHLASLLARSEGARLVLIHVMPGRVEPSEERSASRRSIDDPSRDFDTTLKASRYLKSLDRHLTRETLEVRTILCRATAVASTLEAVTREEGADLLVLGARGAGEAGSRYGRCCRRLLLSALTPVLVIRGEPIRVGQDPARGIQRRHRPSRSRAAGRRRPERFGIFRGS